MNVSRSYKNSVSHPNRKLSNEKFKRQFNKKVRKQTKNILERITSTEEIPLTGENIEELEDIYKGENI
jgi:hypothetical protein